MELKKKINWDRFYKNQKCGICLKLKDSKYKDICELCYHKEWNDRNRKHGRINSIRCICPKCGKRGRLSLSYFINIKTQNITMHSRQIQHWEYCNIKKYKAYSRTCNVSKYHIFLQDIENERILQKILNKYSPTKAHTNVVISK